MLAKAEVTEIYESRFQNHKVGLKMAWTKNEMVSLFNVTSGSWVFIQGTFLMLDHRFFRIKAKLTFFNPLLPAAGALRNTVNTRREQIGSIAVQLSIHTEEHCCHPKALYPIHNSHIKKNPSNSFNIILFIHQNKWNKFRRVCNYFAQFLFIVNQNIWSVK